ncbi:hypothetical protein LI168_07040, partial [Desulfovibrio desulfuricans]|uniref:hypothetical protein n=1 Tax=Desulfovibrio desulfuricans TaxID=876 RepID=UPI001D087623
AHHPTLGGVNSTANVEDPKNYVLSRFASCVRKRTKHRFFGHFGTFYKYTHNYSMLKNHSLK